MTLEWKWKLELGFSIAENRSLDFSKCSAFSMASNTFLPKSCIMFLFLHNKHWSLSNFQHSVNEIYRAAADS